MLGLGALAGFGLGWVSGMLVHRILVYRRSTVSATVAGTVETVSQPRLVQHGR